MKIDSVLDNLGLAKQIDDAFGVDLDIVQLVGYQIPVSRTAIATVFKTREDLLYVFIEAKSKLVLDDIQKITKQMNLNIDYFFSPIDKPNYFKDFGITVYKKIYPNHNVITDQDIVFYKRLAPYNPALAQIKSIKDGRIRTFDPDVKGGWRSHCKFFYNKIDIK